MVGYKTRILAASLLLLAGTAAIAAEARPHADEECVMQCDAQSDKCMKQAGDDDKKAQACDDQYAECLKKCR